MRLIIPLSEVSLVLFLPSVVHTDLHPCSLASWYVLTDCDIFVAALLWDTESWHVLSEDSDICIWPSTSHFVLWGVFSSFLLTTRAPNPGGGLSCCYAVFSKPSRGGKEACSLLAQAYSESTGIWGPGSMGDGLLWDIPPEWAQFPLVQCRFHKKQSEDSIDLCVLSFTWIFFFLEKYPRVQKYFNNTINKKYVKKSSYRRSNFC